jgi:hypothetical protein
MVPVKRSFRDVRRDRMRSAVLHLRGMMRAIWSGQRCNSKAGTISNKNESFIFRGNFLAGVTSCVIFTFGD